MRAFEGKSRVCNGSDEKFRFAALFAKETRSRALPEKSEEDQSVVT